MIFSSGAVGVDVSRDIVQVARAKVRFSRIDLTKWRVVFREGEEAKDLPKEVDVDVEDIVATNLYMEYVVFQTFDVVPTLKREEMINYGKMMASRNLGLTPDDVAVDVVGVFGNRGIFAVSKMENVRKRIEELEELGFPEPDVILPDVFKYIYLTSVPLSGEMLMVVLNFLQNYIAILVISEREIVAVRMMSMELERIFDVLEDQFGISRDEILVKVSFEGERDVEDFLRATFEDLAMEIDREFRAALRDSIKQLEASDIDVTVIYSDPVVFEDMVVDAFKRADFAINVDENPMRRDVLIHHNVAKRMRGALGLLVRCGYEFGKVKSVQLKG